MCSMILNTSIGHTSWSRLVFQQYFKEKLDKNCSSLLECFANAVVQIANKSRGLLHLPVIVWVELAGACCGVVHS